EDPIGKQISANGLYYNVVGVVTGNDNVNLTGRGMNESVLIPVTTMQQVNGTGQDVNMLSIAVYDDVNVTQIEQQIKDLLKSVHNIAPQDDAAVNVFNLQQYFLMFRYLFLGIQILIWIVGMGTLMAGVVGISNIMLVSIRERTSEIGIRRALGAKPSVIMKQIMGESITLTFIAGYAGFFLAVLILAIVDKFTQTTDAQASMFADPQISFPTAIAALTVLVVFGLLAGIIPARNALKIKAIDAIRNE
ncbi:MAG: ABC transporter permease, partial [Lentimicrobiaceae bacterium]|nr:ABC transporter permease [Lentimicrobiaceae bacterium]